MLCYMIITRANGGMGVSRYEYYQVKRVHGVPRYEYCQAKMIHAVFRYEYLIAGQKCTRTECPDMSITRPKVSIYEYYQAKRIYVVGGGGLSGYEY